MDMKLSHSLMDMGFFSALGTSEHPGMMSEEVYVRRGRPNTWDYNNGVTVVYDEEGRPWIHCRYFCSTVDIEMPRGLQCGAHVPHSNDGGHFVREVIPILNTEP